MVNGYWLASKHELTQGRKEEAKLGVFISAHQRGDFALPFVDGKAANDEIKEMAKIKFARGMI